MEGLNDFADRNERDKLEEFDAAFIIPGDDDNI